MTIRKRQELHSRPSRMENENIATPKEALEKYFTFFTPAAR
jgi:hypothetical protein